jgi:hypothetical protein
MQSAGDTPDRATDARRPALERLPLHNEDTQMSPCRNG